MHSESTDCASLLKVLADPTRLAIVEQLMDGPRHVGEVNRVLGVEQTLLSHHLRVLREAGLVTAEREGKALLYQLAPEVQPEQSCKAINLGCCQIAFHQ